MVESELPKRPILAGFWQIGSASGQPGILKAEASNQLWMVRWPVGRFPSPMRSGRPPKDAVFEGSNLKSWV